MLRLIQIPFSHNCIKVRRALELKELEFTTLDIAPMNRTPVLESTGQRLVPALEDGDRRIAESSAILRHLEQAYPERPLLPSDPRLRAECWVLEDWADAAFMAMTRRLAYWNLIHTPGAVENLFFPRAGGLKRALMARQARRVLTRRFRMSAQQNARDEAETPRVAQLALDLLDGRPFLVGDRVSVADVTLATMSAPLRVAHDRVRSDEAVQRLLEWGEPVLGPETVALYTPAA